MRTWRNQPGSTPQPTTAMVKITKIIGMIVISFFALGLAAVAAVKMTSALLIAAFWGVILMGFLGIASLLFADKGGSKR